MSELILVELADEQADMDMVILAGPLGPLGIPTQAEMKYRLDLNVRMCNPDALFIAAYKRDDNGTFTRIWSDEFSRDAEDILRPHDIVLWPGGHKDVRGAPHPLNVQEIMTGYYKQCMEVHNG